VRIDEEHKIANVIVPERQLSLAIGKEGQNARLAAKLTGWRIDIRSDAGVATAAAAHDGSDDTAAHDTADMHDSEPHDTGAFEVDVPAEEATADAEATT
jgi:N utilization substance protein A